MSGMSTAVGMGNPPMADTIEGDRSRSRLGPEVPRAKAQLSPLRGLSPSYTLQQRDAQIQRLQSELAEERNRAAHVVQSSRAANEYLEQLAREDAARAQAEQNRVTQDAVHEIAVLRARVQAMVNGEHAMASARTAQVAEIEQIAEQQINAEASNALGLQQELQRVESRSEVAQ
eukprot:5065934-Prorocentrum_lima.AAC.1